MERYMDWFDGFTWQDGCLTATKSSHDGSRTPSELKDLASPISPDRTTKRIKLTTNFRDWHLATAGEYLNGLCPGIPQQEGHQVHAFKYGYVQFMIPALVLAQAMFRPFGVLAEYVFQPQGLAQLCVPDGSPEQKNVLFNRVGLNYRPKRQTGIQQPLWWMWHFPSARMLWNSMYAYACQGIIAMDLPLGEIEMVAHGIQIGNQFHVTSMTIIAIKTSEFSHHEGISNGPYTIVFHNTNSFIHLPRHQIGRRFKALHQSDLKCGENGPETTDIEWQSIKPILIGRVAETDRRRKVNPRQIADIILLKLSSGTPWRQLPDHTVSHSLAIRTYQQWKADGRWESAVKLLNELRSAL